MKSDPITTPVDGEVIWDNAGFCGVVSEYSNEGGGTLYAAWIVNAKQKPVFQRTGLLEKKSAELIVRQQQVEMGLLD